VTTIAQDLGTGKTTFGIMEQRSLKAILLLERVTTHISDT
tara:strand:+ start:1335 stop:1454 length:120 start_codon:yes stop_codon:yes gene_type:complete